MHKIGLTFSTPGGIGILPPAELEVEASPALRAREESSLQVTQLLGSLPLPELGTYVLTCTIDGEISQEMHLPVLLMRE